MNTAHDYEGEYTAADGVDFEARFQKETELFILSRVNEPTELRTIPAPAFVEAVEQGEITPQA